MWTLEVWLLLFVMWFQIANILLQLWPRLSHVRIGRFKKQVATVASDEEDEYSKLMKKLKGGERHETK